MTVVSSPLMAVVVHSKKKWRRGRRSFPPATPSLWTLFRTDEVPADCSMISETAALPSLKGVAGVAVLAGLEEGVT